MAASPQAIYWRIAPLILLVAVANFFTVTLVESEPSQWVLGLIFGTIFQHCVLAAAWAALGPGPLLWRLPLSLAWANVMGLSIAVPIWMEHREPWAMMWVLTMGSLWLVAQFPLWCGSLIFSVRLRHCSLPVDDVRERQFGIRQLMIFTALIGVLLGLGRMLLSLAWFDLRVDDQLGFFLFLLIAQMIVSVPLIFASLLHKHWLPGILISLLFIALVTVVEWQLSWKLLSIGPVMERGFLAWINFFSAVWVLIFAAIVRGSGYGCGVAEPRSSTAVTGQ
ncbi:hypothetical protein NA78x_000664 [Anatilimnocola sp. NA78]|uniref:hypothetical protein n=1 Tax=Anatilimnocola sp. NA78 TaxID=3415683 RepID=UPI003CE53FE4